MMKIVKTYNEWTEVLRNLRLENKKIGLIPTMGALHQGHISLVEKSLNDNDITVVSIFLNPTQFNNPTDLKNYPISIDIDIDVLNKTGCNYLFLPTYEEIYNDEFNYSISEKINSNILCGKDRPGHFEGVLTVVMKLLQIIKPDQAYFGEKDYQQYILIRDMCKAFFMDTKIISCPIIREESGLAMSSRNKLITNNKDKTLANKFHQILKNSDNSKSAIDSLENEGFQIDYVKEVWGRRFGAVTLIDVRIIDNVEI